MQHNYFHFKLRDLQLEITTACNLRCLNCDRSCSQAPSNESMSITQIEKFVNESIELGWNWTTVGLFGGEPTLHSKFFDVIKILRKYGEIVPDCYFWISTNGYGQTVNSILYKLPNWIYIWNSKKTSRLQPHVSVNEAQIDFEEYGGADFTAACRVPQ